MAALLSAAAHLLGAQPHYSRRQASTDLAIAVAALPCLPAAAAPPPTLAAPQRAATTSAEQLQQDLLRAHAARFARIQSVPAALASVVHNGKPMRSLVATVDLAANQRVAAYPVELVSDDDDHDDTYALGVFVEVRRRDPNPAYRSRVTVGRREVEGISGVPTRTSLASAYVDKLPTIAMFANEPDESHSPNCALDFPLVRAERRPLLGEVLCGFLRTTMPVGRGVELTWCYGSDYVDRGYQTSCSDA